MRLGSNFTGIGSWEKSLQRLEINYDLQFFSEIDKYAIASYSAIHNVSEELNIGDITKVDVKELSDIDILVYSPPCQAFSQAGKQLGFEDKRGILFFESLKIIQEKQPKFALMENVKGLTTKKFKAEFEIMLDELDKAGYNNYYKILNAKDYGIPQNRERIFIVSIRKDIDKGFTFPIGFDNGIRLKHILEKEVDEKYYLSDEMTSKLLNQLKELKIDEPVILHNIYGGFKEEKPRIFADYSPTIRTSAGGGHIPSVLVQEGIQFTRKNVKGIVDACNTLTANDPLRTLGNNNPITGVLTETSKRRFRIRKLMPLETWRLMGFSDNDFYKAKNSGISDTQLYKMAGNSIVVDVPYYIFKSLSELYPEHF